MSGPSVTALLSPAQVRARNEARAVLSAGDALVVDTETTTLHGETIQVAAMDLRGRVILDQLVRPTAAIELAAQQVHQITPAMVSTAPTFSEVAPALSDLLGGREVLAYNAEYDRDVLAADFYRAGLPFPAGVRWQCLLEWRTPFTGGRRLRLDGPHDAAGDCGAALSLLYGIAGLPAPAGLPEVPLDPQP